jgi:hypothetical protein
MVPDGMHKCKSAMAVPEPQSCLTLKICYYYLLLPNHTCII